MPSTTKIIHQYSQQSAKENIPRVEAMPLPPLNFMVTG